VQNREAKHRANRKDTAENKSNHWSQGRRAEEIKVAADLSQNERNRGSKNLSSVASNRDEAPCSSATAAARNYAAFRREQMHRRLGEAQSQAGRLDAAPQRVTSRTEVRNRLTPCSCKKITRRLELTRSGKRLMPRPAEADARVRCI